MKYATRIDDIDVEVVPLGDGRIKFNLFDVCDRNPGLRESQHKSFSCKAETTDGPCMVIPINADAYLLLERVSKGFDHIQWVHGKIVVRINDDTASDDHICPVCGHHGPFTVEQIQINIMDSKGKILPEAIRPLELSRETQTTCRCGYYGQRWQFQLYSWVEISGDELLLLANLCGHSDFILVFHRSYPDYNQEVGYVPIKAVDEEEAIKVAHSHMEIANGENATFKLFRHGENKELLSWNL